MNTSTPYVIENQSLGKSYKKIQALNSLNLKVQPNSICGFLGPDGGGKTTTIKLLLGMMLATFFNNRGPVLGISLALAWAGPMPLISAPIQKYASWLYDIMPWKLLLDFENNRQLAFYVANSQPLPTVTPIIASVLWCAIHRRRSLAHEPRGVLSDK
jgi:hypothetical protein